MSSAKLVKECRERLKEIMQIFNVTQAEICRRTGISEAAMSQYISGVRLPKQDKLAKISKAFNISPAWLMGYDVDLYSGAASTKELSLSKDEIEIVLNLRKADDQTREMVKRVLAYTDIPRGKQ